MTYKSTQHDDDNSEQMIVVRCCCFFAFHLSLSLSLCACYAIHSSHILILLYCIVCGSVWFRCVYRLVCVCGVHFSKQKQKRAEALTF